MNKDERNRSIIVEGKKIDEWKSLLCLHEKHMKQRFVMEMQSMIELLHLHVLEEETMRNMENESNKKQELV